MNVLLFFLFLLINSGFILLESSAADTKIFKDFIRAVDADTPWESPLPDFSYAGYHRGTKPLPTVTSQTHQFFNIIDYGAKPNDGISDHQAFIEAFKAAHKHKGPVAVVIPKGVFHIYQSANDELLSIRKSHFVLKGAGIHENGTIIQSKYPKKSCFAVISAKRAGRDRTPDWRGIVLDLVPEFKKLHRGITEIPVKNPTRFYKGMTIYVASDMHTAESEENFYAPLPSIANYHNKNHQNKNPGAMYWWMRELHTVVGVKDNKIILGEPLQYKPSEFDSMKIYLRHDPKNKKPNFTLIEEVGIEGFRYLAGAEQDYGHYRNDWADLFGFTDFYSAKNCWVRDIRTENVTYLIQFHGGLNSSVVNVALEGYYSHLQVSMYLSTGIFTGWSRENTFSRIHHGMGPSDSSAGNVWYRCQFYANYEAHQKYPHATLYDLCRGSFRPRPGGGKPFNPYHGKRLVFWNWYNTQNMSIDFVRFNGRKHPRSILAIQPLLIGTHGKPLEVDNPQTELSVLESHGKAVSPESIYKAQLTHRLKKYPDWMKKQDEDFENYRRFHSIKLRFSREGIDIGFRPIIMNSAGKARIIAIIPKEVQLNKFKRVDVFCFTEHYLKNMSSRKLLTSFPANRFRKNSDHHFYEFTLQTRQLSRLSLNGSVVHIRARFINRLGEETWSQALIVKIPNRKDKKEVVLTPKSILFKKQKSKARPATFPFDMTDTTRDYHPPDTFHIDLGEEKSVTGVKIAWDTAPTKVGPFRDGASMEILTSNDQKAWKSFVNHAGWDLGALYYGVRTATYPIFPRKSRYVKVAFKYGLGSKLQSLQVVGTENSQ